jgi:hypothetical protein
LSNSLASNQPSEGLALDVRLMEATLAQCGWTPMDVDVDFGAGRIRIELKRHDGRRLTLFAQGSTFLLLRERPELVKSNQWGVRRSQRLPNLFEVSYRLMGRERCEGPRDAMRRLCNYVADNPEPGFPALPVAAIRSLFGPAMGADWGSLGASGKSES